MLTDGMVVRQNDWLANTHKHADEWGNNTQSGLETPA